MGHNAASVTASASAARARIVLSLPLTQQEDSIPDYGIPPICFGTKPAPVSTTNFYGVPASDFERTVDEQSAP